MPILSLTLKFAEVSGSTLIRRSDFPRPLKR